MKKSQWNLLACFCTVGVLVGFSCKTRFPTTHADYKASLSPIAMERGRVLVYSSCAGCHYNQKAGKFIGNPILDVPGIAGKVYSANLTHSKSNGLTIKYTDAQLKFLLKTGIAYDGRYDGYMLRPNMAESDLDAIVAFLRSDDPALAAADTTVGPTHYNFIGKVYMDMNAKPLAYQKDIKRPGEDNIVELGGYLVDNLACFHCHSGSLTSLNYLYPSQSKGFMAGGIKLKNETGLAVTASNITPDKNTGIGNYSREQFIKAVKYGEAPEHKLVAPMPKYKMLTDAEVGAIYAYIQTVPAIDHKVKL